MIVYNGSEARLNGYGFSINRDGITLYTRGEQFSDTIYSCFLLVHSNLCKEAHIFHIPNLPVDFHQPTIEIDNFFSSKLNSYIIFLT